MDDDIKKRTKDISYTEGFEHGVHKSVSNFVIKAIIQYISGASKSSLGVFLLVIRKETERFASVSFLRLHKK